MYAYFAESPAVAMREDAPNGRMEIRSRIVICASEGNVSRTSRNAMIDGSA